MILFRDVPGFCVEGNINCIENKTLSKSFILLCSVLKMQRGFRFSYIESHYVKSSLRETKGAHFFMDL